MKTLETFAVAGGLVLGLGLGPEWSARAAAATTPPPRVVTEADAGPVELARGQALEVRLSSNAGTGHGWRLDREASALVLSGGSSQDASGATPDKVGGPVTTVYSYKATGRGRTELAFTFKRPWEPDAPGDRKAVFKVKVR